MTLLQIYRCFCDETRLRMLHLLMQGPLCVCHFQQILNVPQVAVSKHLAYLRTNGIVTAQRYEQWMIYQLPKDASQELEFQLRCLQDCVRSHPIFREDLRQLKKMQCECQWVEKVAHAIAEKRC